MLTDNSQRYNLNIQILVRKPTLYSFIDFKTDNESLIKHNFSVIQNGTKQPYTKQTSF